MKKLKKQEGQEVSDLELLTINGGGLLTGTQSLFRSAVYFGVKAYDSALTALGALAGLGDGIEAGLKKDD